MKLVINTCYGGFSLSPEATLWLWEHGVEGIATPVDKYYPSGDRITDNAILGRKTNLEKWREYRDKPESREGRSLFLTVFSPDEQFVLSGGRDLERHNPLLLQVVEEMKEAANGACASLEIVEIPDGVDYEIEEYDGREWVAEKHRTWP